MIRRNGPHLGALFYYLGMIMLGVYFTFAAVQGDYGLFKRLDHLLRDAAETEATTLDESGRHAEHSWLLGLVEIEAPRIVTREKESRKRRLNRVSGRFSPCFAHWDRRSPVSE